MTRRSLGTLAVVGIVLLAGCTGGTFSPTSSQNADGGQSDTALTTASGAPGTVAFYISDEPNAIGDFEHLNVTVERVGFERAESEGGGWTEFDGNNATVDLTRYLGANATLVDEYDVPDGNYSKVFVHVGTINATLDSGEQVDVKLPSEKLQITKPFTVDNSSQVSFVFDIGVHKAGNSGKYILRPVISESGPDVDIETEQDDVEDADEDERADDADERTEMDLNAQFLGNATPGQNATIEVTSNGTVVANATVFVGDTEVGTTDDSGRLTVEIPDREEVTVDVEADDREAEIELEFESESD